MDEKITAMLVDDQQLVRGGLKMLVDSQPDLQVVMEADDGAAAVDSYARLAEQGQAPNIVLMDVRMPNMNGIEATTEIVESYPAVKVLILTTFDLDEYAFGALRAGASGFLLKDVKPEELTAAIRSVAHGDAAISARITRRMLEMFAKQFPGSGEDEAAVSGGGAGFGDDAGGGGLGRAADAVVLSGLTEREVEVLGLIAEGLTNQEIADKLYISLTTVKTHVGNILAKIGARDRVQAVIFAYENGLVD